MSHSERRIQRIAVGFAAAALLVAVLAGIIVVTRHTGHATAPASRHVRVRDLAKLSPATVEQASEGVHVVDEALGTSLGLAPEDTIVAISGRRVTGASELEGVLHDLAVLRPSSLFVDLIRDRARVLERWELDGARAAAGTVPSAPPLDPSLDPPLDPLIATVKQLDRTSYEVPRATVDAWLADPGRVLAGSVATFITGPQDGFQISAIRPGSIFAALGLHPGDVIRGINGVGLGSTDQALELLAQSARQITVDVRRGTQTIIFNYLIE
jgi:S1-C subfamily serine protease